MAARTFKVTVVETVEREVFLTWDEDELTAIREDGRQGFKEDEWVVLDYLLDSPGAVMKGVPGATTVKSRDVHYVEEED